MFNRLVLVAVIDLGAWQWQAEGFADWSHQQCPRPGCQQPASLPLQLWGRQTSQVLGLGVQQGECHIKPNYASCPIKMQRSM
jgi:hypothetical protein